MPGTGATNSGIRPPRPGTGAGGSRPCLSRLGLPRPGLSQVPRLKGTAQLVLLVLLARPAGLARAHRGGRPWPARVAELAEDLAQPVVHPLKDGGPLGQVHVLKRGEPADGRVDATVTGGGERRPNSF